MATPLSADRLLAALKSEGCKVVEYRSWRTHNRNHMGPWGPVYGVMIHHTVTSGTDSSVRLCYDGHSTLPGPLCHTVGAKDGTLYMVGNGRANHAGSGDDDVLRAVVNEVDLPADNEADTDGNRHFYGIELVNLGDGRDPWPEEQIDAAARWAAGICRAHGWTERSVIGHLEWQPGKVDPRGFTMDAFRARVRALLAKPPGWEAAEPTPQQEDDMPTQKELYDGVWALDGEMAVPWGSETNPTWKPASVLTHIGEVARENRGRIKAMQAELAALHATIRTMAEALASPHPEVDVDALISRIEDRIESTVVRLDVTPEGA